ncbi:MAG TPA: ABC transporter permease [Candidatus Limnocylindrales bacterium]|nr:ABC transporter permease [Candidatus Limnocylindrales bacterium]
MARFIVRRLLVTIPVLFGIVFVVFILARVVPGDPCRAVLGERATDAVCDAFIQRYGLDKAIVPGLYKVGSSWEFRLADVPSTLLDNQFTGYLGQLVRGDLGTSIKHSRPVTQLLVERLPTTIELALLAMLFAIVVGVPIGLISAYRHNSAADVSTMVFANLGVSMPVFVLGLLLAFIFAIVLKDTPFSLPPSGRLSSGIEVIPLVEVWGLEDLQGLPRGILDFISGIYTFSALITGQWAAWVDAVRHLILPAIALGTIPLAIIARITRSSLLEVLGLDFVRTARAKGLKERSVVLRHGTRNALLPVVTIIGLQLGALLSGAVLTETVFNLAGVGRTMYEAITGRDYVVIQGFTLLIAIVYVLVNLVVDVSYGYLDPRIRYR